MAAALGKPASSYAAYEDPKKFKKPILPLQLAKQVAEVLGERGVDQADVMALAGVEGQFSLLSESSRNIAVEDWLEIAGSVAAGVWREQTEWPEAERYEVRFGPSEFPTDQRFGVRMDGLSMNRTIQPGADLECLWTKFSPIEPQVGDLVIVERHRHDLVELTCKRLSMDGDQYVLLCESYEPEFQEAIPLGKPDENLVTDDEVRVVGIVLSAKLDLAPRGLSGRRYKNETGG